MTVSKPHSKKLLIVTFIVVLLIGGAGLAVANHDPDIIHACIKNGGVEVVDTAGECKNGETEVSLATEAALTALQNSNTNLQTQINNLQAQLDNFETLTRRMLGNNAAVIERAGGSGSFTGEPGGYKISVIFCDGTNFDPNNDDCDEYYPGAIVLNTGLLTKADDQSIINFNPSNTPNFSAIVALLTDGTPDYITYSRDFFDKDGNFASGSSLGSSERSSFFGFPTVTKQVSSAPGFIDLAGIPITNISISVDRIFIFFNSNTGVTNHSLDYRIFFGID